MILCILWRMSYSSEFLLLIVCDDESIVNKTIVWRNNFSVFEFSTILTRCKYFSIFVLSDRLSTLSSSRRVFVMMMIFIFFRMIKLLISCIYLIFVISQYLYNYRKLIILIINRFSWNVFSLIKKSYNDLKFMHKTKKMRRSRMLNTIFFKIASRSKLCVNAYNFAARTLRVTHLHLIDD